MADYASWLRGLAEKGGKGAVHNIDARSLGHIADEVEAAHRRIAVLEMVIREELHESDCECGANQMIVQDIWERHRRPVSTSGSRDNE